MTPIHLAPKIFACSWRKKLRDPSLVRLLSSVTHGAGGSHPVVGPLVDAPGRSLSTSPQFDASLDASAFNRLGSVAEVAAREADRSLARHKQWFTVEDISRVPGMGADGAIRSLPQLKLENCSKQALTDYFVNSWAITESLLSCLRDEEAFMRPPYHELRHPMVQFMPADRI